MGSSVSRLQPRAGSLADGRRAFWNGRLDEALELLRGHETFEASTLRARAAVRVGRAGLARHALDRIAPAELATNVERAEYHAIRATASIAAGDFDAAREALANARVFSFGSASVEAEAEYEFLEGACAFAMGRYDDAEDACGRSLDARAARFPSLGYLVPCTHSRARATHVLGLVAATRGRYAETIVLARAAYGEFVSGPQEDAWIRASLLASIAFVVRDHDVPADAELLRGVSMDDWSTELAPMKFEIHRALGWNAALRGDQLRAFRAFRAMAEAAFEPARKVLASVDRAYLARELGEANSARDEVEHAAVLARHIDWSGVGEERIALAQLAQEVAAFDPTHARALFDRYRRLRGTLDATLLNTVDRRARAYECMAEGSVSRANGSFELARRCFAEAFAIWSGAGLCWRAATAALELAEIGGDARYGAYASDEAAKRPGSWLARRIGSGVPLSVA